MNWRIPQRKEKKPRSRMNLTKKRSQRRKRVARKAKRRQVNTASPLSLVSDLTTTRALFIGKAKPKAEANEEL